MAREDGEAVLLDSFARAAGSKKDPEELVLAFDRATGCPS